VKKIPEGDSTSSARYTIGVMTTPIEGRSSHSFASTVDSAAHILSEALSEELDVDVKVFEFVGPHLTSTSAVYSPFEFLRLGMAEKLERQIPFLLVVSEATLSATRVSYALAFPSRVMNIGILSTNRLAPEFWGEDASPARTSRRLGGLMLHTVGHLLNLEHHPTPANAMYDFASVEDLERMEEFTPTQREHIRRTLPIEARDAIEEDSRMRFVLRHIVKDWPAILQAVIRANPFHLLTELPTMMTAAFSAMIVLFFTAEIWDVASTVELSQLVAFSVIALIAATGVLYRAFTFGAVLTRHKRLVESIVVTTAATLLSLLSTMVLLYGIFLGVSYIGTVIIFPKRLMSTWPTVDPATRIIDHVKLSMFLAAVGLLVGSLGGKADSGQLVRYILFLDEET
jgi:predicted Zn-dependent protease